MFIVKRSQKNPLIAPHPSHGWEKISAFNPSPVSFGGKDFLVYRALSSKVEGRQPEELSTIGIAEMTERGIGNRRQLIAPSEDFDRYGCEDPRVTKIGRTFYITYTGLSNFPFGGSGIKAAIGVSTDLVRIEKHLATPFNSKALAIFPEKVDDRYWAAISIDTDKPPAKLCVVPFEKIEDMWNHDYWKEVYKHIEEYRIDPRRAMNDHVEVGAPPVKTKYGWLLIYSHIQYYFGGGPKVFGIEALLLDLGDPRRVIGRTTLPIITPETEYERNGLVSDIVFPSGAHVRGKILEIYYGGADTVGACAEVDLDDLARTICVETKNSMCLVRSGHNPLLLPVPRHGWEAKAVFNPGAICLDNEIHLIYRAVSKNDTSTLGYARTEDGETIDFRATLPAYVPREDFESKKKSGNSGCEDPRLVHIGEHIHMFYTAYNGVDVPEVATTSIRVEDFLARNWRWSKPSLITPQGVDDKDACLIPEKIKGSYYLLHRINNAIVISQFSSLDFETENISHWDTLFSPRPGMWDGLRIGIAAPPIQTPLGWLLLYHGISASDHCYRVGAVLLDRTKPTKVLARLTDPLLEPERPYEQIGLVPNVVFPCGAVIRDKTLWVYYGGADSVVAVARMPVKDILDVLAKGMS